METRFIENQQAQIKILNKEKNGDREAAMAVLIFNFLNQDEESIPLNAIIRAIRSISVSYPYMMSDTKMAFSLFMAPIYRRAECSIILPKYTSVTKENFKEKSYEILKSGLENFSVNSLKSHFLQEVYYWALLQINPQVESRLKMEIIAKDFNFARFQALLCEKLQPKNQIKIKEKISSEEGCELQEFKNRQIFN